MQDTCKPWTIELTERRGWLRRVVLMTLVSLLLGVLSAGSALPATAAAAQLAFSVHPDRGKAGQYFQVSSNDPCPTDSGQVEVTIIGPNGIPRTAYRSVSSSGAWTARVLVAEEPPEGTLGLDVPHEGGKRLTKGSHRLSAQCINDGPSYAPVDIALNAPMKVSATPNPGRPGQAIKITPDEPCSSVFPSANAYVVLFGVANGDYSLIGETEVPVDSSGRWSAEIAIPHGQANGTLYASATCYESPGKPSTAYASRAVQVNSTTCKDVHFVSVRGSGQTASGPNDFSESPETRRMWKGAESAAALRGLTMGRYQLDYAATGVDVLGKDLGWNWWLVVNHWRWLDGNLDAFYENITEYVSGAEVGVGRLYNHVYKYVETCKHSGARPRVILSGYSQGAMVIHEFLRRLDVSSHGDVKRAIAGVGLVADPQRVSNSKAKSAGGAPRAGYGVCPALDRGNNVTCFPPRKTKDIPRRFRDRTYSICYRGDLVCDTKSVLRGNIYNRFREGERIHTEDYRQKSDVRTVGRILGYLASL